MNWLQFVGPLLHQKPATGSVAELRTDLAAATIETGFTLWGWGGGSKHFLFVLSLI